MIENNTRDPNAEDETTLLDTPFPDISGFLLEVSDLAGGQSKEHHSIAGCAPVIEDLQSGVDLILADPTVPDEKPMSAEKSGSLFVVDSEYFDSQRTKEFPPLIDMIPIHQRTLGRENMVRRMVMTDTISARIERVHKTNWKSLTEADRASWTKEASTLYFMQHLARDEHIGILVSTFSHNWREITNLLRLKKSIFPYLEETHLQKMDGKLQQGLWAEYMILLHALEKFLRKLP